MKKLFLIIFILFFSIPIFSQDLSKFHLYHPEDDAKKEIETAVKEAKKENKHVLIEIGGNWCIWCARFNDFVANDKSLDSLVKANYIVYHLNYSKENKNVEMLEKYRFPNRFGFPVFLILSYEGELLHTQNSAYLEEGKGYSREKVTDFFNDWSPAALDPQKYDWLKVKEQ